MATHDHASGLPELKTAQGSLGLEILFVQIRQTQRPGQTARLYVEQACRGIVPRPIRYPGLTGNNHIH